MPEEPWNHRGRPEVLVANRPITGRNVIPEGALCSLASLHLEACAIQPRSLADWLPGKSSPRWILLGR
jgi:hypothetical protein